MVIVEKVSFAVALCRLSRNQNPVHVIVQETTLRCEWPQFLNVPSLTAEAQADLATLAPSKRETLAAFVPHIFHIKIELNTMDDEEYVAHDHEDQLAPPEQDVVKTKDWLVVAPDLLTPSERVLHNNMEVLGRQMQFLIGQNEQMMGGLVKDKYKPWTETGKKAGVTKAAGAKKDAIAFKAWLSKAAMDDDNPDGDRSHPALTRLADLDDGAATELYHARKRGRGEDHERYVIDHPFFSLRVLSCLQLI